MKKQLTTSISRRDFLRLSAGAATAAVLVACGAQPDAETPPTASSAVNTAVPANATAVSQVLLPTPACGDEDDITPAQTEGPYYTPNTPERASFWEADTVGTPMIITGYVLTTDCQPVPAALLDFWHANDAGEYDNTGYKLRGHFFADDQGKYTLETIVPGLYPGRTRHFHVKVQAPNQPILTTQLYFPDEPENATDGIFSPELVMDVQETADGKTGTFNFVLDLNG